MLRRMLKMLLLTAGAVGLSLSAQGHGENKPGPNQGFIRMPGNFHTEVVMASLDKTRALKVYLLDFRFQNPTTNNSWVKVTFEKGAKKSKLSCSPNRDHFYCKLPKNLDMAAGLLKILANRDGSEGTTVTYPLPLRLVGSEHVH